MLRVLELGLLYLRGMSTINCKIFENIRISEHLRATLGVAGNQVNICNMKRLKLLLLLLLRLRPLLLLLRLLLLLLLLVLLLLLLASTTTTATATATATCAAQHRKLLRLRLRTRLRAFTTKLPLRPSPDLSCSCLPCKRVLGARRGTYLFMLVSPDAYTCMSQSRISAYRYSQHQ